MLCREMEKDTFAERVQKSAWVRLSRLRCLQLQECMPLDANLFPWHPELLHGRGLGRSLVFTATPYIATVGSLVKVPGRGLEPLRISPPDPKSGASANSATPACDAHERRCGGRFGQIALVSFLQFLRQIENACARSRPARFPPDHYRHSATRPPDRARGEFRFR